MSYDFKWEICAMCGWMVRCPKCNMNCCSGGYGEIEGLKCDVCPEAYAYQQSAYSDGTAPVETEEECKARLRKYRTDMEAAGVNFATLDDLKDL